METSYNNDLNMNVVARKHAMTAQKIAQNGNGHAYANGGAHTNGDEGGRLTNGQGPTQGYEKGKDGSTLSTPWIGQVLTCCIAGVVFGFTLEKGRVFEPLIIQEQMTFQRFVMIKMFFAAVASSQACFSLMSLIPATASRVSMVRDTFIDCMTEKSVISTAIGASLLGAGMAICGACPGQIAIQIGHGVPNSVVTFFGGCCGALLYGLTESYVTASTKPSHPYRVHRLDEVLSLPFALSATFVTALLVVIIYVLDLFAPWQSELTTPINKDAASVFSMNAWPPYLSGAIVGCLQVPIVLALNRPLGSSGSYCTITSRLFPVKLLKVVSPYLYRSRSGLVNWWQVIYLSCAVGGAYYSALLSGSVATTPGTPWITSFTGGLVMIYGSRMAGGCTCGHGLSGTGMLSLLSFVAVPFMFVGGVATAAVISFVQ